MEPILCEIESILGDFNRQCLEYKRETGCTPFIVLLGKIQYYSLRSAVETIFPPNSHSLLKTKEFYYMGIAILRCSNMDEGMFFAVKED